MKITIFMVGTGLPFEEIVCLILLHLIIIFKDKQSLQMMEKTFFGCIDMRNAKFQGSIRDGVPDGLGFVFDSQHLFAFSNWKIDVPYGPSLIVFPNRDYFYGKIKNRKPQQLCVYTKASGVAYIFNFVNGVSEKIAYIDDNKTIIELVAQEGRFRAGSVTSFKDKDASKWSTIGKILGIQLPEYIKSYRLYIRETLEKEFSDVVECSDMSGLSFLGFRNTISLGVKFDREEKVRQVGNFDRFPRNIEFGRKYYETPGKANKTEQGRFIEPEKIFVYEEKRPADVIRCTEQYFKQGTNFKNSFLNMGVFNDIIHFLRDLDKQVNHLSFLQFGQKILEGQDGQRKRGEDFYQNKQYTVEEMKNLIYEAVQRRNKGVRRSGDSPLRLSREKTNIKVQKGYMPVHNQSVKQDYSPLSHSRSKRYIYTDSIKKQKIEKDFNNIQPNRDKLTEFKINERDYSPQKPYYPSQITKQNANNRDISPIRLAGRYEYLGDDLLTREKIKQAMLLDVAKKNVSPFREQRKAGYSPSPYDELKSYRNEAISEYRRAQNENKSENFTLGGNKKETKEFDNYVKYKNRNKPVLAQQTSGKKEIYMPKSIQSQKRVLMPRNITLGAQQKLQINEGSGSKLDDQFLPMRHKKNFKYL